MNLYGFLYFLFYAVLVSEAQFDRYVNPWVNVVRRHSCAVHGRCHYDQSHICPRGHSKCWKISFHLECPFGQTCDLSYENCRENGPCYVKEPSCVSSFGIPRPGDCPPPTENMIPIFTTDCYDDGGCGAGQICCHSYTSSYCWFPSARITARSLIPRLTNRSTRNIMLNNTSMN